MLSGLRSRWTSGGDCVCICVSTSQMLFAPLDDLLQRERLVVVGLHDLEQVLAADEFQHQMSGLALLDQVVDARHDGDDFERAEDFGLAAEEVEADGELLSDRRRSCP